MTECIRLIALAFLGLGRRPFSVPCSTVPLTRRQIRSAVNERTVSGDESFDAGLSVWIIERVNVALRPPKPSRLQN